MEKIFHCLLTYVQFTCTSQKTSNCGKNKSTDDFSKSLDNYIKIRNKTDTTKWNLLVLFQMFILVTKRPMDKDRNCTHGTNSEKKGSPE